MKSYTESELLNMIDVASSNMATFYKEPFINYSGIAKGTGKPYTEIVAAWCLEHINAFDRIPQISRESPYCANTRKGVIANPGSGREEEHIAMRMFTRGELPLVGRILDYQTPLKNKMTDKAGKIDLLAFDGNTLRVLELKRPKPVGRKAEESMLRCVLEGFTYLKTVDRAKLAESFGLDRRTPVKTSPFVFVGSRPWREMQEDRPRLKELMRVLDVQPFYIRQIDDHFEVEKAPEWTD